MSEWAGLDEGMVGRVWLVRANSYVSSKKWLRDNSYERGELRAARLGEIKVRLKENLRPGSQKPYLKAEWIWNDSLSLHRWVSPGLQPGLGLQKVCKVVVVSKLCKDEIYPSSDTSGASYTN